MITAFQSNAFQNNAFQIQATSAGWPDTLRRKVPRKDLDRLLKLQRDNTFGRRWFREFEVASKEFAKVEAVAAIAEAAKETREAALLVRETRRVHHAPEVNNLGLILRDALNNEHSARLAITRARLLKEQMELEDDEEAIMLLLQ